MQKYQHFSFLLNILSSFFKLFLVVLALMSMARIYLLLSYGASSEYSIVELLKTLWLGVRLDASILAYIYALAVIVVFLVWFLHLKFLQKYLYGFFRIYFVVFLTLLALLTFSDLVYFSFFGEHTTLMIFGVVDDDTQALFNTARANYNLFVVFFGIVLFFGFLYSLIFAIIKEKQKLFLRWNLLQQGLFFVVLVAIVGMLGRGSVGLFPLAKDIPDVATDPFLNKLPQTAAYAMLNAYEQYSKSKSDNYNLIKDMGYSGKIEEAFKIHTGKKNIDTKDLIANITYTTTDNKAVQKRQPNVVVIMVESFGMPLLAYQSESFDIMGALKKHFQEDTLFTRFISSSNGTVVSLEPLLLNITARPHSTSFAQSSFLNTSFKQASAKVYKDAGYETSFVYGGDLSWRNIGSFVSRQGFEHVEGKATIANALGEDAKDISHDWGIFDGYLYQYIYNKLQKAKKPQFIFVLTTNNHPPYTVPKDYKSHKLEVSPELQKHITGDFGLAQQRFRDYAYALDMAGEFMNEVKTSELAQNTIVAITADNNTVEGIMHYDDYYTQTKRIPFYIYLPKELQPQKKIDTTLASSHKDIFPTLYNLSLYKQEYIAIGTNLLEKEKLHCGFNDAGVIMAKDGGFKFGKAKTKSQKECQKYYKATLAVTEYLIQSHKNKAK